jgi:Lon protease-like protein
MVLFPGLVLPLNVFEPRYVALVQHLLDLPEGQREFGVVAIREGREVGAEGVRALHEVGCTAVLQDQREQPDGRWEIVTTGGRLFRLHQLHTGDDATWSSGDVEWLPDAIGDAHEGDLLGRAVRAGYTDYLAALGEASGGEVDVPELPDDPLVLSHLVAATMMLDLDDRQALLAEPDGRSRLRRELGLLKREAVLLRVLRAAPTPDYVRTAACPN